MLTTNAVGPYIANTMSDIVEALKRELATLEAELENDPRYRKIARISSLLSEYPSPSVHDQASITIRRTRADLPTPKRPAFTMLL